MNYSKVKFFNSEGHQLAGHLELPVNQEPHNFVLFAHCFTCNKNFFAARNISEALTGKGFGVLRFDFTGLGESEGEFEDTNFSGNVADLLAAAAFLEKEHKPPSILVGHSLGGAAVIFAAQKLASVKAVVTLGAPSTPEHVTHLLKSDLPEIRQKGLAVVNLGGRSFTIKEQFLEDLKNKELKQVVKEFDKAFLVMHSPQDFTVGIDNAEELYKAARHPKSFVSLDDADHLLSNKKHSLYAGSVIGAWALGYINMPEKENPETDHQVVANLGEEGFTTQIKAGNHFFSADEPVELGGKDFGPTPYEFLATALASCTSMTIQMYARKKKWPPLNVETHVNYFRKHAKDCQLCEDATSKLEIFERRIVVQGSLSTQQQKKILEIADKCPVHRTLTGKVQIKTLLNET